MPRKDIKQMRSALADLKKQGKALTEEYNALAAKAEHSAEEEARLAELETELQAKETEVEQAAADLDREEKAARRAGLFAAEPEAGAPRRPAMAIISNEPDPAKTAGFKSMAEFAVAVRNASGVDGVVDQRLAAPANYHENGGSAGEGFLVPAVWREDIWRLVFGEFSLLSAIMPEPTSKNSVGVPKDETTPWGATGVQAYWRNEASQMSASKADIEAEMVSLHQLYAMVQATDELLSDAPRLQNHLTVKAAEAIRWKASDAIMWGDGTGKPLGFMNAGSLVTQAKETSQAAATIVAANVSKMYSRLLFGAGNPFWMANSDTLPQLMGMTIGDQPIWTPPSQGFAQAPGGFLLGRPIVLNEHNQTVGTLGDIALVNPAGYLGLVKEGGGLDFASSIHLYFDYGIEAFRWTFRLGGRPHLKNAVSPARGSTTKSHFVALATRS